MIIIAQHIGQLGNRLALFSHFIAFAREHRLTVANAAFEDYATRFVTTDADIFCRYPPARSWLKPNPKRREWVYRLAARAVRELSRRPLPFIHICRLDRDVPFVLDADFARIARRKIVFICGYLFRMPDTLAESAPVLRDYFRPQEETMQAVSRSIQAAREGCDILCGVHIRHGDYREYVGGLHFYTTAEYAEIMVRAKALFPGRKVAFLVCSNEPQEAAPFHGLHVSFGPGDLVEDMYALAACDYIIGPPSTFTVWSSFYGSVPLCCLMSADAAFTLEDFQIRLAPV